MKNFLKTLVASSLLVGVVSSAKASLIQIANFTGSGYTSTYTASGTTATLSGSENVTFYYDSLVGGAINGYTPVVGGAGYAATLSITATFSLGSADQSNNHLDGLTASFTGTVPGGTNPTNLLTITSGTDTNASVAAGLGGNLQLPTNSASGSLTSSNDGLSFTNPDYVYFSSSVINTLEGAGLKEEGYTFSALAGNLASYSGGPFTYYLGDNTFSFSGSLNANVPATTPEPGSLAVATGALVSLSLLRLRRRRK